MKNKILGLLSLGILTSLILMSFASAVITFSNVPTLSRTGTSGTISVTGNITENITFSLSSITESGKTITFAVPSSIVNATGSAQTVAISYAVPVDFSFHYGKTYTTTLTAEGTFSGNATQAVSFAVSDPAEYADDGKLDITIDDITVDKGFGEDTSWYPLDEITAKINVENQYSNSDDQMRNIYVRWGLYDRTSGKWVIGIEKESKFSLDGEEDKTLSISFKLDSPDDFQNYENDKYVFYAWATGDNEVTGNGTSTYTTEDVDLSIESDFVVLDDVKFSTETAACGEEVQLTADVWNIGDSDQQDVTVQIINTKLGINKEVAVGNIDAYEKASLDFTFVVPKDIEAGNYPVKLSVYNEDSEVYQNSNDDESISTLILNVDGACVFNPKLSITAAIESGGKAGQELNVKATVKNTDTKTRTFNVNIAGYASWAELAEVAPEKLALDAGESTEIAVKLNVNKDAEGEQNLSIELVEGNKIIPQPVSVLIEKPKLFSFLTGNLIKGDNWYLWGIGALNVILVLIIIVVAVRVVKKN